MSMSVVEKVCWRLRLGSSSGSRESGIWESMAIFFMPDTEIVWDCMYEVYGCSCESCDSCPRENEY